jgi:hypothetical protein
MPRVVINGFTPTFAIIIPFTKPHIKPTIRPYRMQRTMGCPCFRKKAVTILLMANIDPTDKSNPLEIITMVIPIATIQVNVKPISNIRRFSGFKKTGEAKDIIKKPTMINDTRKKPRA